MGRPLNRGISALVLAIGGFTAAIAVTAPAEAAGSVSGTVSTRTPVAVRAAASATAAKVGTLRNGAKVTVACQVVGSYVKGRVRATDRWDRLTNGRYISDGYVKRKVAVPACPPPPPVTANPSIVAPPINVALTPGAWTQPLPRAAFGGFRTTSRPEHDGVDLSIARWTPIKSVSAGQVVTVRCNTSDPSGSCDVDGSTTTKGCGWYIEVRHEANVVTRYCHLVRVPEVAVGATVTAGQIIGFVGTSGHSSGPHLHFEVHLGYPASRANAVDPAEFMRRAGAPLIL
jgi:hypothetical protein